MYMYIFIYLYFGKGNKPSLENFNGEVYKRRKQKGLNRHLEYSTFHVAFLIECSSFFI